MKPKLLALLETNKGKFAYFEIARMIGGSQTTVTGDGDADLRDIIYTTLQGLVKEGKIERTRENDGTMHYYIKK